MRTLQTPTLGFFMPLYTYVVTFKGSTYVAQDRKSNFKGFVSSWSSEIPKDALLGLTPSLQTELGKKAYLGDFQTMPNKKNVWYKTIDLGGNTFTVYAVQTET